MAIRYVDLELRDRATDLELGERPGLRPKLLELEDDSGYWTFESGEVIAYGFGHPPVGVMEPRERILELTFDA
jgi:hypothetical protein